MKLKKLEFEHEYRGCEIYPDYSGYYWTGPDFDVDAVGDPLEFVATGAHGHGNTMADCQEEIDTWAVEQKMDEVKASLADFSIDEQREILCWALGELK